MTVRRLTWLAIPLAVAALAAPATAASRAPRAVKQRTVKVPYTTPGGDTVLMSGVSYVNGQTYGAAVVDTQTGDRTIAVSIADDHSPTVVAGELRQDPDGDGQYDAVLGSFCGKTGPVKLAKPGVPVVVYILVGPCGGTGVSVATTGTVTATIAGR